MVNKIYNFLTTSNMYIYLIFNEILVLITLSLLVITFFTSIHNFIKIKEGWYIIIYLIFNYICLISKIDNIYLIFKFSKRKIIMKRNYKKFFLLNIINLIFMFLNVYSLSYFFMIPYIINLLCLIFLKFEEYKYPEAHSSKASAIANNNRRRIKRDIEMVRRYQM